MKNLLRSNFCSAEFGKDEVFVGEMIGKVRSGLGILIKKDAVFEGEWRNNEIVRGV